MRAAIFRNGNIVADTIPDPVPAAGQVFVKTLACGICGSDLHIRKHAGRMADIVKHFPGRKPMDLARDVVLGHEFCCEVIDYGPSTQKRFKPGTRVCSTTTGLSRTGCSPYPSGIWVSPDGPLSRPWSQPLSRPFLPLSCRTTPPGNRRNLISNNCFVLYPLVCL